MEPRVDWMKNLIIALNVPLLLGGCGVDGEDAKAIELLRGEVARLKAENLLTANKGEETERDVVVEQVSFPPLPLKWQSKGGIAEATEDLRALHLATQRYLEANDDVWPNARLVIALSSAVQRFLNSKVESKERQDDIEDGDFQALNAYGQFWEGTLKPFGATAEHWRHSEHPVKDNQPFYMAFTIEAKKGAAYQDENQRWFGTRSELRQTAIPVEISSSGRIEWLSETFTVQLPVDARNQNLPQSTSTLAKINIRPSGAYVVMGEPFTSEQVSEWLTAKFDKTPDLKVLIRCDQEAKHLYVANVISICRMLGVPKANIAVKTEK